MIAAACPVETPAADATQAATAQPVLSSAVSPELARQWFALILGGAGLFGAVLGAHRGGWQILSAGVKLPLVVLLTAVVCTPVLTRLNAALGRRAVLRDDLALVLSSLARGCLVLLALAPVQLVAALAGLDYHRSVLLAVTCCSVAGAVGLTVLVRGLWKEVRARRLVTMVLLSVFTLVGTRMSWTLRPYLVRPCARDVPIVRALDGSFVGSVETALDSAQGHYNSETCSDRGL
jgi:hypothetical protein